MISLKSFKK